VNGPDLAPPESWRKCAERMELLREAAMNVLRNPRALPEETKWARFYVPMIPSKGQS
jgi:hypothetical protein